MAGYSGTPLWKKLGIKPGNAVVLVDAPAGFEDLLAGLPEDVKLGRAGRSKTLVDVQVVFVKDRAALAKRFASATARMKPDSGLWFAWPKKASGVKTDVTEDVIRDVALAAGLVDNKVCAVDETWSGLRVVVRVKDRPRRA
jgi:hypothetical protein